MEIIINSKLTRNRKRMVEILSLLKEIIVKPADDEGDAQPNKETDEQPDTTDMPDLESEESVAQKKNQSTKGLKILTPDQMLSRLPIYSAQFTARNNSEKLKNEIRQLLYSLCCSKKLTKTSIII